MLKSWSLRDQLKFSNVDGTVPVTPSGKATMHNHDLWARASPNPDKPIGRYNHAEMSYVGEPS